ncbi:MAG: 16S rRNA (guanine(966)-N(2))-methyltransferase RsmD [SAR202 cluster bacterium Io17-Chloro-G3]|nr:MAG: 16S rRNA (guanine(966)-N(2))-methyltransferase RsmD [SAR202 cluster bacterium Io17-Chloro-G3]
MRITGGNARGMSLVAPRSPNLRPTSDRVRISLFNLLGAAVAETKVLDLYAGSGALGIEALSRGATSVDFVEADRRLCRVVKRNLESTGYHMHGSVHHAQVERALGFLNGPYQTVFLDPPYALAGLEHTITVLGESTILDLNATVVVEHSSRVSLGESYGSLTRLQARRYGDSAISIYQVVKP